MSFWVGVNSKNPSKSGLFGQKVGVYSRKTPKTGLFTLPGALFKSGAALTRIRYLCNMYIISTVHTYIKLQTPCPLPGNSPLFTSAICHCQGFLEWFFCLCLLQMLKKGKIDLEIPLLKFQFPFLNFFTIHYQITFSIIFFKVTSKGAKLCKVALGMLNDRGNSTTSPCLVWLIVKLICYTQT